MVKGHEGLPFLWPYINSSTSQYRGQYVFFFLNHWRYLWAYTASKPRSSSSFARHRETGRNSWKSTLNATGLEIIINSTESLPLLLFPDIWEDWQHDRALMSSFLTGLSLRVCQVKSFHCYCARVSESIRDSIRLSVLFDPSELRMTRHKRMQ
jgi:hypothetical protein